MTDENSIQISSEVTSSNHAALAAFFENRSLVASQRYLDAMVELRRVNDENAALRATIAELAPTETDGDEVANTSANLKRVNIENEELRASIALMSKPRPQDEEDSTLAELLRAFIAGQVFTKAAIASLVNDAKRVVSPAEVTTVTDAPDGEAS